MVQRAPIWLLAILVVVAALFLAAASVPNWNWLRGPIAHAVSVKTGRALNIGGDLDLAFGWRHAHIRASHVTFANPPWATRNTMIDVEEVALDVALLPLFRREIVIDDARLDHAELAFETSLDGRKNWLLDRNQRDDKARVVVRHLAVSDGRVAYDDPARGTRLNARVATLQGRPDKTAGTLTFSVHGRYRGQALVAQGTGDSVLALRDSSTPYHLNAAGQIGPTRVRADGRITNLLKLSAVDLQIALRGGSLAQLYPLLGVVLPDTPPYATRGRLLHSAHQWRYERFTGRVGKSDIAGTLRVDTGTARPYLVAEFNSKSLNFADLGPLVGTRQGQRAAAPSARPAPGRVLPDTAFRTGRWTRMDANVTLKAESIVRPEALPLSRLSTHLQLRDGDLRLDPLRFDVAGGTLAGSVRLDGRQPPIRAAASLKARKLALAQLFPTLDRSKTSLGELNGVIELKGRGDTVAAMLGSADGRVSMLIDGGEISKLMMETVSLHVLEMLQLKLAGDEPVRIRCGIADFGVAQGVMRPDMLVLDTDVTRIDGAGRFDLRHEALDLTLRPKTRKLSLVALRTPIHVRGSFAHPQVNLDKGRLALRGLGSLALGAVNPALALIPLIDAGSGGESGCRRLIEEAGLPDRLSVR